MSRCRPQSFSSLALLVAVLLGNAATSSPLAKSQVPPQFAVSTHDFIVKNFRFQGGDTLPEVRIRYRTIGQPQRDAAGRIRNAVLVLHGSSGDAGQVLAPSFTVPLLGPGGPLDANTHYLIFPDNLGNGGSTKPSDGLRARFPKYGYVDMVELQRRLVREHLGIERLRLILGISMGAMHTWMWGARFPEAMDALVPIAALPSPIQGRNLLWRTILTDAIRNDPQWNDGNYAKPPRGFLSIMPMFDMLVQSPTRLGESISSRARARAHLQDVLEETLEEDDANNILYRFEASFDYDVEPDLERIRAPLLTILFADDELNPLDGTEIPRLLARVPQGRMVIIPAGPNSEGHRTQVKADVWKDQLHQFLNALPAQTPVTERKNAPRTHIFVPERFYNTFSGAHPPALHIAPGDRVITKTVDAGGVDWHGKQVAAGPNPQTGPFYIEGAEPGDMLLVTIIRIETNRGTAYSGSLLAPYAVDPASLVARVDREPRRVNWLIDKARGTARLDGPELGALSLPLRPMLGCLAVAPARKEAVVTSTPGAFGGNMDYAGLNAGVKVMLPVSEPGALLFLGDGHARQGEGELVGTGLETSMDVEFTVDLVKKATIAWPRLENDTHIMVLGSERPLLQALQHATSELHRWLMNSYGLSERGASLLMGQAAEFEIANVVDPHFTVVAKMRKALLTGFRPQP